MKSYLRILSIFIYISHGTTSRVRKFPPEFMFGASTSAYQTEGAWQEDGKGLSIWDVATHTKGTADGTTGDIAADSYHLYKRDIEIAKEMGLHFYKFSISWPRILPTGFADTLNHMGIQHYHKVIAAIIKAGMIPLVTMYHLDLPENLQQLGGWANSLIVDWFAEYARVLFNTFGRKVKHWITVNEPYNICYGGYGSRKSAPMLNFSGIADYVCAKNVLLAHAAAYHLYDETFKKIQEGNVGIAISYTWYEPSSESPEDQEAAMFAKQFEWGIYTHPIFSRDGDFPNIVIKTVASKSAEQGFPKSRLPELTGDQVILIRGSADFLGVTHYTTVLAYRDASVEGMYPIPSMMDDVGAVFVKDPAWTQSAANWIQEVPWGFQKLLLEIRNLYDNPPVYITENGWPTTGGLLDEDRIRNLRGYLNALLNAIKEGCNVKGYSVWSLIDSMEWMNGYQLKFGLYQVDFSSSDKSRMPRKSAFVYKQIVRTRTLDPAHEPEKFLVEDNSDEASGEKFEGETKYVFKNK